MALKAKCSKTKFANTTTPLTPPLDDSPMRGQVSGVPLYNKLAIMQVPITQKYENIMISRT